MVEKKRFELSYPLSQTKCFPVKLLLVMIGIRYPDLIDSGYLGLSRSGLGLILPAPPFEMRVLSAIECINRMFLFNVGHVYRLNFYILPGYRHRYMDSAFTLRSRLNDVPC